MRINNAVHKDSFYDYIIYARSRSVIDKDDYLYIYTKMLFLMLITHCCFVAGTLQNSPLGPCYINFSD